MAGAQAAGRTPSPPSMAPGGHTSLGHGPGHGPRHGLTHGPRHGLTHGSVSGGAAPALEWGPLAPGDPCGTGRKAFPTGSCGARAGTSASRLRSDAKLFCGSVASTRQCRERPGKRRSRSRAGSTRDALG